MTSGNNGELCARFEPIFVNETKKCLSLFYLDQEFFHASCSVVMQSNPFHSSDTLPSFP